MKRQIFKSILFLVIVFFIGQQIYFYNKYDGNTWILVSREADGLDELDMEVYIDGIKVIKENLFGMNKEHCYSFNTSPWKHILEVKAKNGTVVKKEIFYSFFMRFIDISYTDERFIIDPDKNPIEIAIFAYPFVRM